MARPQAILIGKMIPEWVAQGVSPAIVTAGPPGCWSEGASLYQLPVHGGRVDEGWPSTALGRWVDRVRRGRRAMAVLELAVRTFCPNVLFSFANPQESNVLGARLARRTGLPFVSHFSDPWVDNPFKRYSMVRRGRIRMQERRVIRQSRRVVFTNESALQLVMGKYRATTRERGVVVPHCFDTRLFPPVGPRPGRFTVSYIGALYGERGLEPFLGALRVLLADHPEHRSTFHLRLVGTTDEEGSFTERHLANLIAESGLADVISPEARVSYLESLAIMKTSNCLLVIDADFPKSPFLPSKVVDYAGSRRPIIGITPEDSPTARLLRRLGQGSFAHQQVREVAGHLANLIQGAMAPVVDESALSEYDVRATTRRLLEVMQQALVGPPTIGS
jgi:glycosyltransferase involved in cell wall biosynthesis